MAVASPTRSAIEEERARVQSGAKEGAPEQGPSYIAFVVEEDILGKIMMT